MIRVSTTQNGDAPNGYSFNTSISGDGRYVAFHSTSTNNASDFWFDLRTYGLDESYDIYYLSTGDELAIVKLSERNFFDFVREYCLGTKLYDPVAMPENMVIQSEQHEFFVTDETGAR
ncbi:hypothetical protein V2H45_22410 [Tumidithrix elongata RA019]|uniref:Uncharacterized protein n=1 Tax=Tumidithrix elongata BACA0141 TaxID=2716417 RepID=A0AAW9Q2Z9_9CYAN|nr:hypothetical protein [Tumidithrix elongata RA019]